MALAVHSDVPRFVKPRVSGCVSLLQRLHSLRAYQQALELYEGRGWTLAEDYVQFCLAKHSFNLHRLLDAKESFGKLLSHESIQSASLQRLHLQDYIYVHKVSHNLSAVLVQCAPFRNHIPFI